MQRDKSRAIHKFWSSFGLKAYEANSVPSDALSRNGGRYLSYELATASDMETIPFSASLWYKSTDWVDITAKADEINFAIGVGGTIRKVRDGYIWIRRGVPFTQRMSDEDDTIRRIVIQVEIEFLTMN